MRTLIDPAPTPRSPLLFVLLGGSYSEPEDFVREEFPRAARARVPGAEIAMVGTLASGVADGSIVDELHARVIEPAHARGRTRVWLAGISLGGTAAIAYAARHEARLEGIVLLAPYPGTREVLLEIERAGGPRRWKPGADSRLEAKAWEWLAQGHRRTPVHLYFGSADRFAAGQRLMASALPCGAAVEMEGGHDWAAWRRQWERFLDEHGPSIAGEATGAALAGIPG